jgi:hypothetical protein
MAVRIGDGLNWLSIVYNVTVYVRRTENFGSAARITLQRAPHWTRRRVQSISEELKRPAD